MYTYGDPNVSGSIDVLNVDLTLKWSELKDVIKTRILKAPTSPTGGIGDYAEIATVDSNLLEFNSHVDFESDVTDAIVGYKFEGLDASDNVLERSNVYTLSIDGQLKPQWTVTATRVKADDATIDFEEATADYTGDAGPAPEPDPDQNEPQPLEFELLNAGLTQASMTQGVAFNLKHGTLPSSVKKVYLYASQTKINDPNKDQTNRWAPYDAHDDQSLPSNDGTLKFNPDYINVSNLNFIMNWGHDSSRYYIKGFDDVNAKSNSVASLVYTSEIMQVGTKGFEDYPNTHDMTKPGIYHRVVPSENVDIKTSFAVMAYINLDTGDTTYKDPTMDPEHEA